MSPRLKLCGMQATITAEKKGCNTKRFLLLFLYCSYIRNWVLLILFNTRDYHNFGTRKCAQNVYFVKEMEEEKLFCEWQILTLGSLSLANANALHFLSWSNMNFIFLNSKWNE
jgi:hypothetical protein